MSLLSIVGQVGGILGNSSKIAEKWAGTISSVDGMRQQSRLLELQLQSQSNQNHLNSLQPTVTNTSSPIGSNSVLILAGALLLVVLVFLKKR